METINDQHHSPFKVSLGRLVARLTFLRHVKAILCWENKIHSILLLLLYTFICIYPILLLALPVVVYAYLSFYEPRKTSQLSRQDSATDASTHSRQVFREDLHREAEFQKNLDFLKSSFEKYCVFHDVVYTMVLKLKKKKDQTWTHLEGVFLVTTFFMSILVWIGIPYLLPSLKYMVMVVGWFSLTFFSPLIQTLFKRVQSWIPFTPLLPSSPPTVPLPLSTSYPSLTEKCVEVFENQRWWFGLGFQPLLLSDERPNWSNLDGTVSLPSKESLTPPIGYFFTSPQWKLDPTWTPSDNEGWVYMDHFWKNKSPTPRMVSVTRTRKWIRSIASVE